MKADLQRFKENDVIEPKVISVVMPSLENIGTDLDSFYDGAFSSYGLGGVLYDLGRDPLSGVITREIYVKSYPALHDLFTRPGTFEYYLSLFRAIWGEGVSVNFTIPDPGVLMISVSGLDIETFQLVARQIEGGAYAYNHLMDREGNNLAVRDITGTKSQSEIDALMFEIVPDGIYCETTLTL